MKKVKLMALAALSLAFVACEPDENTPDEPKENVVNHEGKERNIDFVNIDFGFSVNSLYNLYLDLHNGSQANSWSGGDFMLSFGVNSSDSLLISPGTYSFDAQGGANTFSFFELITVDGTDTNTFIATGGTLYIEESAHEGNYKLNFDVDTQHDTHTGHTANLTGNYSGSTQYYSIKGIENE